MKKIKLLKTLLIPTIGITAIGTIAAVSTSCSSAVHVTGVSLNKESLPLGIGESDTLIATINPENATDKSVTWSSSDSSVATVDNNGKVTAVSEGQTTITVTTNDGAFTDTCQVTVYQEIIHVIGVWLDKESLSLEMGESDTLTATVLPENATDKSVTWSSSNSSVATVDNNGKVTAVKEGQATITVTTNDGGFTATCQVTVNQKIIHVTNVSLDKDSLTLINEGDSDTLIATVHPEDATDKSVTWSSSDSSVATVDNNGNVTSISEGQATITVTTNDGGFTATCQVTVHQEIILVTSVSLNKNSLILDEGGSETLTATVLPKNATDKSVTWSSSDSSVATVDNNGKVTAVKEGQATITVTTNDGGFTATCQVTVNQGIIHVIGVWLNKESLALGIGESDTLTATVLPENAADKSVTWSSSDSSVATVDNNGKVTAVDEGSAKITVKTNDGGHEGYCNVTVSQYFNNYICVTAIMDSTLELINEHENNPNLQYSTDGVNWTTYSELINITKGRKMYLKGDNPTGWSKSTVLYSTLYFTGLVSISGNVMALLDNGAKPSEEGDITTSIPNNYCFSRLFQNSSAIASISEHFLPATSLTDSCYFCIFSRCTSLTTAPALPAMELASYCYGFMFQDCTSLATAPALPATELAEWCYYDMFKNCKSLTTAPDLPATTLPKACYCFMFENCTSLNSIKIAYTGDYNTNCLYKWAYGVADSGTFYYNGSQTAQDFQLPSSWTKSPF